MSRGSKAAQAVLSVTIAAAIAFFVGVAYATSSRYAIGPVESQASASSTIPQEHVIPQGTMSDAQAQEYVDTRAEQSRIMINIAPEMVMEDGRVRLAFVVAGENNGLSERLEITQNGKVTFASEILEPGNELLWADAQDLSLGSAIATIYAVDDGGKDFGSAVNVEVKIVPKPELEPDTGVNNETESE